MSYTIDESLNAKNFTPHDNVLEVFGTTRQTQSITIHHWGALGQRGQDILAWFCNPDTTAQTSAHFVVWDNNIYCIVSPNDAAWHAGNAYGNATSIGIECHPEATEGDYNTVAWLINWLRNTYGDMPLFPHKHWVTTDCPGVWDLNRLDSLARNPAPTPVPTPIPAKKEDEKVFFAKLPNDNAVYISNGITYRHVEDPETLQHLIDLGTEPTIHEFPNTNVLGTLAIAPTAAIDAQAVAAELEKWITR